MMGQILLVEDNPSDAKLTTLAFKRAGLVNDVTLAVDGEEALRLLLGAEGSPPPAQLPMVVLLDLNLPKVDGLGVLKALREHERTKLLPVIVLTSSREQEDVLGSYALGANAYVRKPVDFEAFVSAAKTLGMFWLMLNERPPEGIRA